jgi:hypothetical protein
MGNLPFDSSDPKIAINRNCDVISDCYKTKQKFALWQGFCSCISGSDLFEKGRVSSLHLQRTITQGHWGIGQPFFQ